MDTATLRPREPAASFVLQPPARATPAPDRGRRGASATRFSWHLPVLGVLLLATLLLRLWGVKQGLPFSYNSDEAQHFVPKAIGFFGHSWNPNYFLNPPGYTDVLAIVFELWYGSVDAITRAYTVDPTSVFIVARVVAAVLGTISVWLTYLAGSRFWSRDVGLLAAAIFGLAFLPIFYSHLALNDVPTLAPVALSLYGLAGVYRTGRRRDYLIAGAGIGLAAATKYTGGITLVCLLVAAVCDGSARGWARASLSIALAGLLALACFTLANPYWILDWSAFTAGISSQASLAAGSEPVKLGTSAGGGILYYLWTFSWGLGLGPAIAALAGAAILLARRAWGLAAIFIPAPIAFIIFMGVQQRYFGRWLMPIFPLVSILAAFAAVEIVRSLDRARLLPAVAGGTVITFLLLTQSVTAVIHNDEVLSRPDTINLTRAWMVTHIPAGQKVVIEPVIPSNWPTDIGRSLPWTPTGQRWYQYPTWVSNIGVNGKPLPDGERRYVVVDEYERVLRPSLIAQYESEAYCWVVVGSLQFGRAYVQPNLAPGAIAYYKLLAREGHLVYSISPFSAGAHPVPFGFDWSIDYYPRQYHLPGPVMNVYHLTGGLCAAPKS